MKRLTVDFEDVPELLGNIDQIIGLIRNGYLGGVTGLSWDIEEVIEQ
jgi:hypothetical protein